MERTGTAGEVSSSEFAVAWCPAFRLQAVMRRTGFGSGPVALVDDALRQSVVLACNAAAARGGVEEGMPTVRALARCPELRVERPSTAAELAMGRWMLETALGWVPGVEETEIGLLTLDLSTQRAELRLGGARHVLELAARAGYELVIGLGETPSLARIAALGARRRGEVLWRLEPERRLELLDRLPLTAAETGTELNERLRGWGVRTLGAFARLEREAVAARLGEEAVALWLRLAGRHSRPLDLARPEAWFEESEDFDHEVTEREPLLFRLEGFVDRLLARVSGAGRAATAMHLSLSLADGSCHARRLPLPEPTLDREVVFHLVGGHLERFEPEAPVVSLRLRVEPSDPVASQRVLFGAGLRDAHRFEETLQRLRRIVGAGNVGSPRPVDHHRPGAFELAPLPSELAVEEETGGGSGPPRHGPVFRCWRPGVRAAVRWRDGEPVALESSRLSGVVAAASGPWKCDGHWWRRGESWEREEWDVELLNRGLYRLVASGGEWWVAGRYG